MTIKQLSVFIENRQGRLADITKTIAEAGVDIRALSVADTTDYGILRLIVSAPDRAVEALRAAGMTASTTEVIGIIIPDEPGGFAKAVAVLSEEGISIEYAYAFITPTVGRAYVIIRVEDNEGAQRALSAADISIVSQAQIEKI